MIVYWHRQGIYLLPVPFVTFLAAKIACDDWFGRSWFYLEMAPKVYCGLATVAVAALVGFLMNRGLPPRRKHRLYFLPVEYWFIPVALVTSLAIWAAR